MSGYDNMALALPSAPQSQLNIYDLYRGIQNKKMKRNITYNAVLQKCHTHIKRAADAELFMTMFVVPEFIVGAPLFDINHCTAYVISQLRANGFVVNYYYPRALYISWDIHEKKDDADKAAPAPAAAARKPKMHSMPEFEITQPSYKVPDWDPRPNIEPSLYSDSIIPPPQMANSTPNLGGSKQQPAAGVFGTMGGRTPFSQYITKFKPSGKFVLNL